MGKLLGIRKSRRDAGWCRKGLAYPKRVDNNIQEANTSSGSMLLID